VGLLESHPEVLISIRKRSPLSIMVNDEGVQIASDFRAINSFEAKGFFQPDGTFSIMQANQVELYESNGRSLPIILQDIAIHEPVYERSTFAALHQALHNQLRNFLQHIFPDRIMPEKDDELIALVNTMLHASAFDCLREEQHVMRIVHTLSNLEDGTYGLCFTCGYPISESVLAMHPHMSVCHGCHKQFEARA